MGIVESELASFELSAFEECRLERNSDGSVHLHVDGVRVEFSRAEFDRFARVVAAAGEELEAIKTDCGDEPRETETETETDHGAYENAA